MSMFIKKTVLRGVGRSSFASLVNTGIYELERRLGRSWLFSNPDVVQIEPSTHCNLSCSMCGRQAAWKELVERASHMSRETFLKLAPFLRTARFAILHGWGEPLMSPHFTWMVEKCKEYGCLVDFDTNGLLLTGEMSEELVAIGLDCLSVSLDAATAGTYRDIRGGDFDQLLNNLDQLDRIKKRENTSWPKIKFTYTLMKRNLEELPLAVDLAGKYRTAQFTVRNLIEWPGKDDLQGQAVFDEAESVKKNWALATAKAAAAGMVMDYMGGGIAPKAEIKKKCAYQNFAVFADGSIGPCGAQKYIWGNVNLTPLRELWNGPNYQEMRIQFREDRYPHHCAKCPAGKNLPEDHRRPDMSYVDETLAKRRWDMCE